MTDYNSYISHEDLVEVISYITLDRNDPLKDRLSQLTICEINNKQIVFGVPRVQGRLTLSWKRFLAVSQLLKSSLN